MLIAVLHLIPDEDDPWRIVASFMDAVPSGKPPGAVPPGPRRGGLPVRQGGRRYNQHVVAPMRRRTGTGWPGSWMAWKSPDPGLVQMHQWRPEASHPVASSSGYAVVARKP
jgi:hypothetical protein